MDDIKWKKLISLAGYVQDGSCETVSLFWDDATRTALIQVGKKTYGRDGCGFETALSLIPEQE